MNYERSPEVPPTTGQIYMRSKLLNLLFHSGDADTLPAHSRKASVAERMGLSEKLCNFRTAAPAPVGSWNTVKRLLAQDLRRQ